MEWSEIENRLREILVSIRILWSTLEAVHDAMRAQYSNPETYQDAVYGAANTTYRLREELQEVIDLLAESSNEMD